MNNITNQDIANYTVTGTFDVACSFKADKDSTESKKVTLRIHMKTLPLSEVIQRSLSPVKIAWQNGPGRKNFSSWKNHQVVEIGFTAPGKTAVDPMMAIIEHATSAGVNVKDKKALTAYIMAELEKQKH